VGKERKRKYARYSSQRHVPHSGEESASDGVPQSKQCGELRYCGKRADSTNEYIKIILILRNIPTTAQVGIGWLKALQLGVDGRELLSQKSAFCCFERDSTAVAIFVLTSAMESCFVSTCDMLETQRGRFGGKVERRATRETEQGSANYFCAE
jgi:hypothetical protein